MGYFLHRKADYTSTGLGGYYYGRIGHHWIWMIDENGDVFHYEINLDRMEDVPKIIYTVWA